jgi:hypothetical protein
MRALALPPGHERVYVSLHDALEGRIVEVAVGDPAGKLAVPHEGVAAQFLAVLRRPVGVLVTAAQREGAAAALGRVPLHIRVSIGHTCDHSASAGEHLLTFMAFSGVTLPNSVLMMFCSELSLRTASEVPA